MRKERLASGFGILIEEVHLRFGIAFGQDGHIDAVLHAAALVHVAVRSDAGESALVDEDITGTHLVGERGAHILMRVLQRYGHDGFLLGEGEEERVLVALLHAGSFFFAQPFLEEAGERSAVDDFPARLVRHGDFTVAGQREFRQVVSASSPVRQ